MKKTIAVILMLTLFVMGITACSSNSFTSKDDNKVVIYSSSEDYRNEYLLKRLKEQFPNYDITLQYQATGNNAAKLKAEGKDTECDIVLGLETGYLEIIKENLADLSSYNTSMYVDNMIDPNHKYLVWERFSGGTIINTKILSEKGIAEPKSYQDLLKPEYKGLISMPNPKSSGTGYIFLLNLINAMGEKQAFEYFDQLAPSILQFTSSGSGPVNALVQGEAAIGLGMTFQAVKEINNNAPLKIVYFSEGAPYTTGGYAIIEGKQDKQAVKDVFDYINTTLVYEDKEQFLPEQIFKEQMNTIPNYPQNIPYGNMKGINDTIEKERVLSEWIY
ncbi:MAG: extracellular solute-binding protein [Eubacterium sp.]